MSDLMTKALLSGLGLASLTKSAIQKTVEDLIKKSDLSEEEGKRLMKALHRRSSAAQKTMEKTVETAINKLLKNLHLSIVHEVPKKKGAKTAGKRASKTGRAARPARSRKA
jgi:polyhydroxyalkanoate synthesis regulator phasin